MSMEAEAVLAYRGLELTAAEIADALWLAAYVTVETAVALPPSIPETDDQPALSPTQTPKDGTDSTAPPPPTIASPLTQAVAQGQPFAELYRAPEQPAHQRAPVEGIPFYAPAGEALPNKLQIARALRPLLRRVPSFHRLRLDEEATAEAIADGNDLALVLQPEQERWLDLILLIDESPSMVIWHHAIQELHTLLTQVGAFGTIESWGIGYEVDPETQAYQGVYLHVTSGGGRVYGRRGTAKELVTSTQRRLILVLSDSSSPAWQDGSIAAWLNLWGQHNLVTLAQFMPRPFWPGTGLSQAVEVVVRAAQPGSRNNRLTIDEVAWYWQKTDPPPTPPVPVTTLDPHLLHDWAQLLSGRGQKRVYGYCFTPPDRNGRVSPRQAALSTTKAELDAEARLLHYQQRLSPLARLLTGYLAAVPLSLPIMRLVQKALLPDTTSQLHLAELFHSGILRRSSARYVSTLDPDTLQYDFLDDALRGLFLTSIGDGVKREVLRKISQHIDKHSGLPYSFQSLLFDPTFSGRIELDDRGEPFARVAAQVLRSMGGIHAELADRLAAGVVTGVIEIAPDLPPTAEAQAAILENAAAQSWQRLQETAVALLEQIGDSEVRTLLQGEATQTSPVLQTRLRPDGDATKQIPAEAPSEMRYAHELEVKTFLSLQPHLLALWKSVTGSALATPPSGVAIPHIVKGAAPLTLEWCWIPGGRFKMGSKVNDREKPIHEVQVDGFWLARHPVTNGQYRQFIEASGYTKQRYWTAEGWQTRQTNKWTEPRYWRETKWNGTQQPVVGVSWYEAKAFCAWAAEATGESIRLPTEAEWEKGSRGINARTYPWGEARPNDELCHFNQDSRKGSTKTVGQFSPQGDSPYGCADMGGNVWDWTADWFLPYPGNNKQGDHYGKKYRVVRGGSWNDRRNGMRCAFRFWLVPVNGLNDVGFRCACTTF